MDVCGVRHECRLRGTLKKSNKKDNCIVGDMVEIEEGAINQVYERENILYRPLVSNLSYIAITFACKDPDFDSQRAGKGVQRFDLWR